MDGVNRGRSRETENTGSRRRDETGAARRAHLPASMRRRMVLRDSLGRVPAECAAQTSGTYVEGEIRGLSEFLRSEGNALLPASAHPVPLRRGTAAR